VTMKAGRVWYKEVSPYERCVAAKEDYALLAKTHLENGNICKKHSGQAFAACINGKMHEGCKSLTHW